MTHGVETLQMGSLGVFNFLERSRKYKAKLLLASVFRVLWQSAGASADGALLGPPNPIGCRSVYDDSQRFAEAATISLVLWGIELQFCCPNSNATRHQGQAVPVDA
jgi:hypothetical protein